MDRLDIFPDRELIDSYRRVFSSPHGKIVLQHMLFDLGVFSEETRTEEDVALRNYGSRLLAIISGGGFDSNTINALINAALKQPIERKQNGNTGE